MLITIYGSKELFVTEYQSLLAERLLALPDYNMDAGQLMITNADH